MDLTIRLLPGEPLWTPEATHVIDPVSGRTCLAKDSTDIVFVCRAKFEHASKMIAEHRQRAPQNPFDMPVPTARWTERDELVMQLAERVRRIEALLKLS